MPVNPRLRSHLLTEMRTPAAAEWLMNLCDKILAAAPDGSYERKVAGPREHLSAAMHAYRSHRAQGDQQRTTSHNALCRSVCEAVSVLVGAINLNKDEARVVLLPASEAGLLQSIDNAIESGDWCLPCGGCRNYRRIMDELDGIPYCQRCIEQLTFACKVCKTRHRNDLRIDVASNRDHDVRKHCLACAPPCCRRCGRCDIRYTGDPASGVITAGEFKRRLGLELCWKCSGDYQIVDCGHVTDNPHRLSIVPNVEDDDRELELVRRNGTQHKQFCEKCYRESVNNKAVDVLVWNQTKKSLGGRQCREIGSKRSYGVELEVCQPKAMGPMPDAMKASWTAKRDASLPESGVELASTIFKGDEGLAAVKEMCDYAKEHKWSVDCRAGYHLHIGLSDETPEQVAAVAIGYLDTYHLWCSFVAPSRVRSKYCRRHRWQAKDLVNLEPNKILYQLTAGENSDIHEARRVWCNWHSYLSRATIEIRNHQGTLIYEKVANWIKAHTRFVDWCVSIGSAKAVHEILGGKTVRQQFLYLAQAVWHDRAMARWFRERSAVLHGDLSHLPLSNRKLRAVGIDPKSVTNPETVVMVSGHLCHIVSCGTNHYIIGDSPGAPRYFLNKEGKWSTTYQVFGSRQSAASFARAFSISRESGMAFANILFAVRPTEVPARPAETVQAIERGALFTVRYGRADFEPDAFTLAVEAMVHNVPRAPPIVEIDEEPEHREIEF